MNWPWAFKSSKLGSLINLQSLNHQVQKQTKWKQASKQHKVPWTCVWTVIKCVKNKKKSFNKIFDQETIYLQRIKGTIALSSLGNLMMVVAKFSVTVLTVSLSKTIEISVSECKTEKELIIPTAKEGGLQRCNDWSSWKMKSSGQLARS